MTTTNAKSDPTLAFVAGALADTIGGRRTEQTKSPASSRPKIYLADNSRLRPDAHRQRAAIEQICDRHGLVAEWPSEHLFFPTGLTVSARLKVGPPIDDPAARRGLAKSWRLIGNCQALVAEVSAFRGAHMSPLIAFEIGVAVVHAVPVFAWTKDVADARFIDLFERFMCINDDVSPDGNWRDDDGDLVENFGLVEFAAIAGNFVSLSRSIEDAIAAATRRLKAR